MGKLRIFSVVLVLIQLVTNIILIKSRKKNKTTMSVVLFIVSTMYLFVTTINTLIVCGDVWNDTLMK